MEFMASRARASTRALRRRGAALLAAADRPALGRRHDQPAAGAGPQAHLRADDGAQVGARLRHMRLAAAASTTTTRRSPESTRSSRATSTSRVPPAARGRARRADAPPGQDRPGRRGARRRQAARPTPPSRRAASPGRPPSPRDRAEPRPQRDGADDSATDKHGGGHGSEPDRPRQAQGEVSAPRPRDPLGAGDDTGPASRPASGRRSASSSATTRPSTSTCSSTSAPSTTPTGEAPPRGRPAPLLGRQRHRVR